MAFQHTASLTKQEKDFELMTGLGKIVFVFGLVLAKRPSQPFLGLEGFPPGATQSDGDSLEGVVMLVSLGLYLLVYLGDYQ